jgi:probable poly-beta-1,6-N-acetyl-D-glucosamine export protein
MNKNKLYNPAIDILRIIAILAVILIHTTTRNLEVSVYKLQEIPLTLFLNQAARFAVPLFFMISGFVLELNYHLHESYLQYLKKRISRIFIPYLFWSVIYYFFIYIKGRNPNFISAIIRGDASYQLYFIPTLIVFYLLFPIIHKYFYIIGNKYVIIFLGLAQLLILYFDYNIHSLPFFYPLSIALLNYFVFIAGVAVARNQERFVNFINKRKLILGLVTVIFALFVYFEGLNGYLTTHNYTVFYSSFRPSVLIYTLFLAGFLYWVFKRNFKFVLIIKTFSRLSFFVFFTHIIILEAVWYGFLKNIFNDTNGSIARQLWYDPMYFLIVMGISFTIAYVVHKIPYASKLTG